MFEPFDISMTMLSLLTTLQLCLFAVCRDCERISEMFEKTSSLMMLQTSISTYSFLASKSYSLLSSPTYITIDVDIQSASLSKLLLLLSISLTVTAKKVSLFSFNIFANIPVLDFLPP